MYQTTVSPSLKYRLVTSRKFSIISTKENYLSLLNPSEPGGNISSRFKQCYSYESTILKYVLLLCSAISIGKQSLVLRSMLSLEYVICVDNKQG